MKYILLFIFIYLIYRFFKGLINTATSVNSSGYGHNSSHTNSAGKKEGDVHIEVNKEKKFFTKKDGEYVDFEEVK